MRDDDVHAVWDGAPQFVCGVRLILESPVPVFGRAGAAEDGEGCVGSFWGGEFYGCG